MHWDHTCSCWKHLARGFKEGHGDTRKKWCMPAKLSDKAKNRAQGPLCIICRSRNSLPVSTVTFRCGME